MPRYDRIINPENQALIEKITNSTNTAEGSVLPPRQVGPTRVPIVTGLRLLSSESSFMSAIFTLTWTPPVAPNIAGYNIYVKIGNRTPSAVAQAVSAPAHVQVVYTESMSQETVTFYVQTVLKNGFVSDINLSPTLCAPFPAMNFTFNASATVKHNGTTVGTRPALNFIDGSNVTLTINDDSVDNEIDITIASSGGGGVSDGDKGDITVSGSGTVWTIDATAVTYSKIQNVSAASKLLGRGDSGSGSPQEITLGTGLSMSGTTLNSSGGVSDGDKGDITVTSTGTVWTIDSAVVTFAKIQNIATDRLLGRDTASTGSVEELTVTGGVEFTGSGGIQRSALTGDVTASAGSNSTTIANNAVTTAKIIDAAVTYAKIQDVTAASKLLGRGDSGSGDVQEITLGSGLAMTGTTLSSTGGISDGDKGDITVSGSGTVWTIDNTVVTYAKMQNVSAASKLIGRGDSGSGSPQEITLGTGLSMSGTTLNSTGAISDGDKGDITTSSSGTVWTIDNDVVTFAKMQNISTGNVLGRYSALSGDVQEVAIAYPLTIGGGSISTDATLTALAGFSTTGIMVMTATDTFTSRSIAGGTGVSISNGDGVSGNPTINLDATLQALASFNSDGIIVQTAADTFTSRTITGGTGVTITNGNGVSGNPNVALDATLVALSSYNVDGLLTQTAADTFTGRTITAGNGISVTNGNGVSGNPTIAGSTAVLTRTVGITIDGGGSTITTGSKGFIYLPFAGTITQVVLLANASGSIVVDIKKSTYTGFPTTSSICASAKPTLSSAQKSKDSTLTGWTTTFSADDVLEFNVDSATTVTRVTLVLTVTVV